jgi:hypothetical protein
MDDPEIKKPCVRAGDVGSNPTVLEALALHVRVPTCDGCGPISEPEQLGATPEIANGCDWLHKYPSAGGGVTH